MTIVGESDVPAMGPPANLSIHLAISSIIPAGSVHKSRGDSVVRMCMGAVEENVLSCVWVLQRDIVVLDVIWCRLCVNMI